MVDFGDEEDRAVPRTRRVAEIRVRQIWRQRGFDTLISPGRVVELLEFGLVGLLGVFVNTLVFLIVTTGGEHYLLAGVLAFFSGIQATFFGNRRVTFDDGERSILAQFVIYNLVAVGGLIVYELTLFVLVDRYAFSLLVSNSGAILAGGVWNYLGAERVVFT